MPFCWESDFYHVRILITSTHPAYDTHTSYSIILATSPQLTKITSDGDIYSDVAVQFHVVVLSYF